MSNSRQDQIESTLARRFGRETVNYFSGSPLNRLSFLRANNLFLQAALKHPNTSVLLLKDLAPLVQDASKLAYATYDQVRGFIGENPFEKNEEELIKNYNSSITLPLVLFLGINEHQLEGFEYDVYKGKPYFAVDVTPKGTVKKEASNVIEPMMAKGLSFIERHQNLKLSAPEAAIFAQARALIDWNSRNQFCAGCGQSTLSVNAGSKRVCPPTDYAHLSIDSSKTETFNTPHQRLSCVTRSGISNLSFPRTDPAIISAVISHKSDKILLGRQRSWPKNMYSTLAGFVEPGESIEEAVRREVWEESGVNLGRVVIHSTQPWPYPANLMIGTISQALPDGETIHLEFDPELEDAQWFALNEVREALNVEANLGEIPNGEEECKGKLRLPPKTAIANTLLRVVLDELLPEIHKL